MLSCSGSFAISDFSLLMTAFLFGHIQVRVQSFNGPGECSSHQHCLASTKAPLQP